MNYEITMDNKDPSDPVPILRVTVKDMKQNNAVLYVEERFPGFKLRYIIGAVKE